MKRNARLGWIWAVLTLLCSAMLAWGLSLDEPEKPGLMLQMRDQVRVAFLPGPSTHGHHQIEMACGSCHTDSFGEKEVLQDACMNCHQDELKKARDSHPKSKFTDPRNAERVALLDARWCATCHLEHKPDQTLEMGFTLAQDSCVICHEKVAEERPSHTGMGFMTCADAGCHNYHDNTALYEAYLLKHADQPAVLSPAVLPARDFREVFQELEGYPLEAYPVQAVQTPDYGQLIGDRLGAMDVSAWLATTHAQQGVNCSACHQPKQTDDWIEKPSVAQCQGCHVDESKTFLSGKHGMTLAIGRAPMLPVNARLPMKAEASHQALSCSSCHGGHEMDTRKAAVESCQGCHNDGHTLAYGQSAHADLWAKELAGDLPAGSGVTCATCHMPRVEHSSGWVDRILVQHNQNYTLQPNEKMIRATCQTCHGLQFTLNALADKDLIKNNFKGKPSIHVESIDMAVAADAQDKERRKAP